jgi:hypothetical protein
MFYCILSIHGTFSEFDISRGYYHCTGTKDPVLAAKKWNTTSLLYVVKNDWWIDALDKTLKLIEFNDDGSFNKYFSKQDLEHYLILK